MANIKYYAPAATTEITLSNGTKLYVNSSGYVTADRSLAPELLQAGFTAGFEDAAVFAASPSGGVAIQLPDGTQSSCLIKTVTIGNQAGTYPANLSVPTATSAILTYYPVLFGGVEVNEANATISGTDGARAGIIVPSGFRYARFTSLIAAGDNVNNTTGAGWYAVRIRSVGTHGTLNLGNTRMKAIAADAFSTPSTNVQTTTPWLEIGVTLDQPTGFPLVSVGDKIEAAIWQNSGVTLSIPFDTPSTWLMAEFR